MDPTQITKEVRQKAAGLFGFESLQARERPEPAVQRTDTCSSQLPPLDSAVLGIQALQEIKLLVTNLQIKLMLLSCIPPPHPQ